MHFAGEHLRDLDDPQGFSFVALCHQAGAFEKLREAAIEKSDAVSYVSSLLAEQSGS